MARKQSTLAFVALAVALASAACSGEEVSDSTGEVTAFAGSGTTPLIVDYSPTASDVPALIYLSQHPDVDLLAVTIPSTGESRCEAAVPNTVGLLARSGVTGVPVACGAAPNHVTNQWPDAWRDGADRLGGMAIPVVGQDAQPPAAELLVSAIDTSEEPVTLVTLGPLTNIAAALKARPDIVDRISMVYVMGGAVEVGGNVTANGVAEWNVYIDPTATDVLLRSGAPVTLVPLDATNHVPVRRVWVAALGEQLTTPAAETVHDLMTMTRSYEQPGFFFWDELAAAVAMDESLVTIQEGNVSVRLDGVSEGMTRFDPGGSPVRVARDADQHRFEAELLAGLTGDEEASVSVPATPEIAAYFEAVDASAAGAGRALQELFADIEDLDLPPEKPLSDEEASRAKSVVEDFWDAILAELGLHLQDLESLVVPASLVPSHDEYVAAATAVVGMKDTLIAAVRSSESRNLEDLMWNLEVPEFETAADAMDAACTSLMLEAQRNQLEVELLCEG